MREEALVKFLRSDQIWSRMRHFFYNAFAKVDRIGLDPIHFMNYGYVDPHRDFPFTLENSDQKDADFARLYYQLFYNLNINSKDVLEIGAGRGGGVRFIAKYFNPQSLTALDRSQSAVDLMKKRHQGLGINHIQGDALETNLPSKKFDVVLNVESSHCYLSRESFYEECFRLLKDKGWLLCTDFVLAKQYDEVCDLAEKVGFEILEFDDITEEVLKSLRVNMNKKLNYIESGKSQSLIFKFSLVQNLLHNMFVTSQTADNYRVLKNREERYFRLVARKK